MSPVNVSQILRTPLQRILLTEGDVLHAVKKNDPGYVNFGEAYFSQVHFGAIKAWKRHLRMTLNLIVPIGEVIFIFVDGYGGIRREKIGENDYARLTVPPGIWFGFYGASAPFSLIMNIADIPHDPLEIERGDKSKFKFEWSD